MEEKNKEELENKKENKITLKTAIIIWTIIILGTLLMLAIVSYNIHLDEIYAKKPIIYLYPEKTT